MEGPARVRDRPAKLRNHRVITHTRRESVMCHHCHNQCVEFALQSGFDGMTILCHLQSRQKHHTMVFIRLHQLEQWSSWFQFDFNCNSDNPTSDNSVEWWLILQTDSKQPGPWSEDLRESNVDAPLGPVFPSPHGLSICWSFLENTEWGSPHMKIVKLASGKSGFWPKINRIQSSGESCNYVMDMGSMFNGQWERPFW